MESLKEEFYSHCRDYIDKKKNVQETVLHLREKVQSEKTEKQEALDQLQSMQANIDDMRRQITTLIEELDNEARGRDHVEKQKTKYKSKLRVANQRMRHVCDNFEQMALLIYQ